MLLNDNDLIPITEFARLSGWTRQTIYNWLKRGDAPNFKKIGDRYYFYREDALKLRKTANDNGN